MIKLTSGQNQSYARAVNNELVIQRLRVKDYSATELAHDLGLSHAALSSILRGLTKDEIIKISYSISVTGKGRKQVYYSLNESYGILIVVSLSDNRYTISFSNIKEEILFEEQKEIELYDVAIIYEIILRIKQILQESYNDIPLRHIIIAVPGRVNSITGELQLSKQFDIDLFRGRNTIISIFENHFSVPVTMDNDINLSILGELKYGCLKDVQNAMLAYIDNGIGGALLFNGNFYGGDSGYAGELGLTTVTFNGQEAYLDEFASLRSLKNHAKELLHKKFTVADLVEEYQKKGPIYEYVNQTAHLVGKKLRDVVEILNISNIVLSGRVSMFGDDYLKCIQEELCKSQNQCEVQFSLLGKKSILFGAISKSVDCTIPHVEDISENS